MRKISADVAIEFASIASEVDHLRASLDSLRINPPADASQEGWEAAHICASAAEKIYTGFERVLVRIVRDDDGARHDRAAGWHRQLLQDVATAIPGGRPAVVSEACLARLDRLRAFRHRERNTYGFDLDLGIVLERSAEAVAAFDPFQAEITRFLDRDRRSEAPDRG